MPGYPRVSPSGVSIAPGWRIGRRSAAVTLKEARLTITFELRQLLLSSAPAEADAVGGGAGFLLGAFAALLLVARVFP